MDSEIKMAEQTFDKICSLCKTPFRTVDEKRMFCSGKCEEVAKKTRNCEKCGKPFIRTGNRQKYCRPECKKEAKKERDERLRTPKTTEAISDEPKELSKANISNESVKEQFNRIRQVLWTLEQEINKLEGEF